MARVQVVNETASVDTYTDGRQLSFQWCRYLYDDGSMDYGYRFIWKDSNGRLQPARGQARIPSMRELTELTERARFEGWGTYDANKINNVLAV